MDAVLHWLIWFVWVFRLPHGCMHLPTSLKLHGTPSRRMCTLRLDLMSRRFPKNKNYFAAGAVESIVMQLFLLEVRERCVAPSVLWLHDGFWIDKSVGDEVLYAAEWHVRKTIFPASCKGDPLFRIVDLTEARAQVLASCPRPPFPPLFPPVCSFSSHG